MTNTQATKAETLATTKGALSGRRLSLLGLFGPQDAMQALVRLPSGRIQTVTTGSRLPIGRIVAIDAQGLLIDHRGETRRLPILTN